MVKSNEFCISSCLAFRYIADSKYCWENGLSPLPVDDESHELTAVKNSLEVKNFLKNEVNKTVEKQNAGILLSGGIDSAILAAFLPVGTNAYTIKFIADGAIDESIMASKFAKVYGLNHHVVEVTWNDYLKYTDALTMNKKSILHPVEVALYKASIVARSHGVEGLILGNGADSTFGGLDKLLSKDWEMNPFIERYSFINPENVLKEPKSIDYIYKKYDLEGHEYDYINFLKYVHGYGVIEAFNNAIRMSGLDIYEPYELLKMDEPLDLQRIRNGESKYILRDIYNELYPNLTLPEKIAFARPMDVWLKDWNKPASSVFKENFDYSSLRGDQKWLIYNIDRLLDLYGFNN
ncbi:asparagine synthase C-terminal domain-containing protein [Spirochaeta isovalerica]|uniref:asparagine synthase (glutamine-hydrolyzing) n=1 Tax=Spirochaeta isovalerica TaxID=150 RepID=A0A841RD17_9SPIO|nr:asparagine synthase C-terminal domain-containing protein [Spirochaeta isovalerica]MBB6480749.1 asparagine synthetase B (glutamine-hydrolyzing) [Spirochaeta isovalerica]